MAKGLLRRIGVSVGCLAAALAAGAALAGCFDVQQSMTLQRDLSGQAAFSMTVNFEPMVQFMAEFQRSMAGQKGEPTAAELEKVRQDFLASRKSKAEDSPVNKEKLEKSLPPGIKLIDSSVQDQGLKMVVHLRFAFDNVAKLGQINLPSEGADQPGSKNPFDRPFGGLQVVDEGKTLLLTSPATNPLPAKESMPSGPDLSPDVAKQMEAVFKGFRVAFQIETPFEVVESNATRREGKTLYWEYDLNSIKKMTPEQSKTGIRARFRK
ncbi:MAG TPA: hypothetical protein VHR45_14320 [Thermoanaerobaculia bacterium]|nr:hypothetical protein [Thermoanaerobaculia bacterium]